MDTAMLFDTASYLRVWRYDIRRSEDIQAFQPDILGSVSIRMFRVSACFAGKEILRPSICLFGMPALIAPWAGVLWVNKDHRQPCSLRFVGYESAKLRE